VVIVAHQHSMTPNRNAEGDSVLRPRVVFADDNAQFLDHAMQVMAGEYRIVGTAGDGPSTIDLIERLDPDLAVLDITMPILDGLEVARRLRADGVRTQIIFLTVHDDPDYLREALAVGAMGYVVKHRLVSDLPQAIHDVLAGRRFVSASSNLQSTGSEESS
jgi:DNA-binding NarL/FixJ family response regulator